MSWQNLLANGSVNTHTTSRREIENLRDLVNRDLKDAEVDGLSDDRRFATAYNAVLQLSKMAIACSGYRVSSNKTGHHRTTFEGVKNAVASQDVENLADYFETCRRKRNLIDYDATEVASETEADELVQKGREFQKIIEDWISDNYPAFK